MSGPCPLTTIACRGSSLPVVTLVDRRNATAFVERRWLFQQDLESLFYGNETSTGAMYRLLMRANVQSQVLTLRRTDVGSGLVTRGEWEHLLALRGDRGPRVRTIALIPVEVVSVTARTFGQSSQTRALLDALALPIPWVEEVKVPSPPPEAIEPDETEEVDVLLEEELKIEERPVDVKEKEAAFERSYALPTVPDAVNAEFESYAAHRTAPINRLRGSGACIHHTVCNDRANALRFLGWLHATEGIAPSLSIFGEQRLGEWVEAYLAFLKDRGLRQSSMANYTSCLLNVVQYVRDMGRASADVDTVAEVLRLRKQCERNAKSERMYAPSTASNWIDWELAQRGRVQAIEAWQAHTSKLDAPSSTQETLLLRDVLIMLFHTVQPPDRVGVVRKLRLGHTLKRGGKHGYILDLTVPNAHKTAKFYGPTATSISKLIVPWLGRYLDVANLREGDSPYLFHPQADHSRALSPSQWCAVVKTCFHKHTGVACSPKQLRASFVTWLKGQTDAPDTLRAAAASMRHQEKTQGSAHYDTERNDRLVAAAVHLCENYARTFAPMSLTDKGRNSTKDVGVKAAMGPGSSDEDDNFTPLHMVVHEPPETQLQSRDASPQSRTELLPPSESTSSENARAVTVHSMTGTIQFRCRRAAAGAQISRPPTPPTDLIDTDTASVERATRMADAPVADDPNVVRTPPPGNPSEDPPAPPARPMTHEQQARNKKPRLLDF